MTKDVALIAQARQVQHDKEFHKGMEWFKQGCDCPRESSPVLSGWLAAREMHAIKAMYLEASREQFIND